MTMPVDPAIPVAVATPNPDEPQPAVEPVVPAPVAVIPPAPAPAPAPAPTVGPVLPSSPIAGVAGAVVPVAPAPAAAPVDLQALASILLPQLIDGLGPALRAATRVAQAGENPAAAAQRTPWGVDDATFAAGNVVSHGYYDHIKGENVVRSGIVLAVHTVTETDAQGNVVANRPGYDVGWLVDTSSDLPSAELRLAV